MLSYEQFLAQVQPAHWELLSTFSNSQRVTVQGADTAGAAGYRQRAQDLYNAGMCWRVSEGRERDQAGDEWVTFEGHLTDAGRGYVVRAARERATIAQGGTP